MKITLPQQRNKEAHNAGAVAGARDATPDQRHPAL